jgi:hypothetical protein
LYHPDVNPSPTANEDFLRVAESYRILSDRRLRTFYDQGTLVDHEESLRRRAQQHMAEQFFDNVVTELLRRDEEETRARQVAVMTVVSLFFSAFIVALFRPPIFESLGWPGWLVCLLLFSLGVGELVKGVRSSLKYYTFDDDSSISLMDAREVPDKPFTREEAWLFLIGGYLLSVGLGLLVRYLLSTSSGAIGHASAILSVLLLPPACVFLVARVRALGIFESGRIDVR